MIVAESEFLGRQARNLIEINIEEEEAITTASEAYEKEMILGKPRHFSSGNTKEAFENCDYIFEGKTFSNGQEHLYLETQGCYVIPQENDGLKIFASTQAPTNIQVIVSRVLGIPMHKIEVDVQRLGGGFGGKEDQATAWSTMAAVAVQHLKIPVKIILNRHDDLYMTGKRHPYESTFKIGLTKEFKNKSF